MHDADHPLLGEYDALLVAGGTSPCKSLFRAACRRSAHHIAVDSGGEVFRYFRRAPDSLIGDLDSVTASTLEWCRDRGSTIRRLAEQETVDVEKAVRFCRSRSWQRVLVLGSDGDRPDHLINSLDLAFRSPGVHLEFATNQEWIVPLIGRRSLDLDLPPRNLLSWIGWPRAEGCSLTGAQWPVHGRALSLSGTRSISNAAVGGLLQITQRKGRSVLFVGWPES